MRFSRESWRTVGHDKAHTYRYDMFKLFFLGFMFLLRPSVQQVMEYLGYVSGSTNQKTVLWSAFSKNISQTGVDRSSAVLWSPIEFRNWMQNAIGMHILFQHLFCGETLVQRPALRSRFRSESSKHSQSWNPLEMQWQWGHFCPIVPLGVPHGPGVVEFTGAFPCKFFWRHPEPVRALFTLLCCCVSFWWSKIPSTKTVLPSGCFVRGLPLEVLSHQLFWCSFQFSVAWMGRNNNSSRFGKYNRVFFDETGTLVDASATWQ